MSTLAHGSLRAPNRVRRIISGASGPRSLQTPMTSSIASRQSRSNAFSWTANRCVVWSRYSRSPMPESMPAGFTAEEAMREQPNSSNDDAFVSSRDLCVSGETAGGITVTGGWPDFVTTMFPMRLVALTVIAASAIDTNVVGNAPWSSCRSICMLRLLSVR